jgi:hypothetical protein
MDACSPRVSSDDAGSRTCWSPRTARTCWARWHWCAYHEIRVLGTPCRCDGVPMRVLHLAHDLRIGVPGRHACPSVVMCCSRVSSPTSIMRVTCSIGSWMGSLHFSRSSTPHRPRWQQGHGVAHTLAHARSCVSFSDWPRRTHSRSAHHRLHRTQRHAQISPLDQQRPSARLDSGRPAVRAGGLTGHG